MLGIFVYEQDLQNIFQEIVERRHNHLMHLSGLRRFLMGMPDYVRSNSGAGIFTSSRRTLSELGSLSDSDQFLISEAEIEH
jgi:hypothetical protein